MITRRKWERRRGRSFGLARYAPFVSNRRRCRWVPVQVAPMPLFKLLGRIELELQ